MSAMNRAIRIQRTSPLAIRTPSRILSGKLVCLPGLETHAHLRFTGSKYGQIHGTIERAKCTRKGCVGWPLSVLGQFTIVLSVRPTDTHQVAFAVNSSSLKTYLGREQVRLFVIQRKERELAAASLRNCQAKSKTHRVRP